VVSSPDDAVTLLDRLPATPGGEEILDAFLDWAADQGFELYAHQEDAIIQLLSGDNVVLATPTGSGKSLVALAGMFAMLSQGRRAVYTAPIKALVSEKFFELTAALGAVNVGMVTGDASVNADAPVITCTAEILANRALREGPDTDVDLVVMDEFHYYGDRDRGWAWQVPLLQLPDARFLLMSATLGDTTAIREDLSTRTGRDTSLVSTAERPVPLDFEYRETPLHESINELLAQGKAPVYIVHFTQKEATARAQSLTSLDVLSPEEKATLKAAVGEFRFDTPIGRDLKRFVLAGIGVHHAGMLPKYRLLVEKLAQQGHLKLICGTDTLGMGVNVPIRTVLFTQLCKFDGRRVRVLSVRDFQQIAGRAGRRGFDNAGSVWVQAPDHVVENKRAEARAAVDPKKRKKLVKRKPPERGYAHWDGDTLARLSTGEPEVLMSSFAVSHAMLLNVLDRPGDGCAAMKRLLVENHEPRRQQRHHIRRAISVYRSLIDADIVEVLAEPDHLGRPVRVNLDLQDEFRLNQPLSLFVVEAIGALDAAEPDFHLQVLSLVEAVLDDPTVILLAQLDRAKDELMSRLKAEGVEYEQRMEELAQVTWPRPEAEFIEPAFDLFARHHPWVGRDHTSPKSIVREMLEHAETFNQYVARYGLKRSEGLLLRYLTDCYKTLVQTVPADAVNEDLGDVIEWLGAMVRRVDSSLLDEWERLLHPDRPASEQVTPLEPGDLTANRRAFGVLVRNEVFRWVQLLAHRRHSQLVESLPEPGEWTVEVLDGAMLPYWEEHDSIGIDGDARAAQLFDLDHDSGRITQILDDPAGYHEWIIEAEVDSDRSRELEAAVVRPLAVRRR
jgi:superfamily II RNA helicase